MQGTAWQLPDEKAVDFKCVFKAASSGLILLHGNELSIPTDLGEQSYTQSGQKEDSVQQTSLHCLPSYT